MCWLYLLLAIVLEVTGTISMKYSQGFHRLVPSILVFVFYLGSLTLLTLALERIDIAVAYAIWSGVGTTLISVVGFLHFKETATTIKIASIAIIIVGVVGLHLSSRPS